jgi:hypothetical protein
MFAARFAAAINDHQPEESLGEIPVSLSMVILKVDDDHHILFQKDLLGDALDLHQGSPKPGVKGCGA